ncbi:N-acetylmuramoyl-L-alanine amidase [Clostridium ganghwense]|uniref:N-acetylmuramoyl-L-alanine amidase n=1 Tax=Clostridium ganghwense TaxID=312089 RepID=A0ABT4CQA5_9CLOT|nr:N-acetylmuramoyl-L-alanine amidase [Clostridium ganghwense]MCY6371230.1 N-acetylmuramoyl-L-alanine amidase [Clostridium ganghwense]
MKIIETNLNFGPLSHRSSTKALVLHHAQHKTWNVYDVHAFHKNGRHWSGIGYHFFIDKNGHIFRGRPENVMGAHCLHHNHYTLGICVQGDYMQECMPAAQKQSVIKLCKYLCSKYNIKIIKGHKELSSTDCPGTNYPLSEIKNNILSSRSLTYTVKKGDTLWAISRKYNLSVSQLKALNNLSSEIIYPNQMLKLK